MLSAYMDDLFCIYINAFVSPDLLYHDNDLGSYSLQYRLPNCITIQESTKQKLTLDQMVARSHCVVSMSKTLYPLISTGST